MWASAKVQRWIGYAWWRRLHMLTFLVWLLSTVHGIATGTDTKQLWALATYAAGTLAVVVPLGLRLLAPRGTKARRRPLLAAVSVAVVAALAAFTLQGPLRPGWNRIANNGKGSGQAKASSAK